MAIAEILLAIQPERLDGQYVRLHFNTWLKLLQVRLSTIVMDL